MPDDSEPVSPVLVRLGGAAASVRLKRPLTIVGSKRHAHLRIISPVLSGTHALLLNLGNNIYLRDLMTRRHVYVNDRKVSSCRLKYGDIVRFGEMRFRFIDADVLRQSLARVRPAVGELLRESDGQSLLLDKPLMVIGRHSGADIVVQGEGSSRAHAVIFEQEGRRVIRDLGSRIGTLVNEAVVRSAVLRNGDTIRIGSTLFRIVVPEESADQSEMDAGAETTAEAESTPDEHVFVSQPSILSNDNEAVEAVGLDKVHSASASPVASPLSDWSLQANESSAGAWQSNSSVQTAESSPVATSSSTLQAAPVELEEASSAERGGPMPRTSIRAELARKRAMKRPAREPVEELVGNGVLSVFSEGAGEVDVAEPAPTTPQPRPKTPKTFLKVAGVALAALLLAAAAFAYYLHASNRGFWSIFQ